MFQPSYIKYYRFFLVYKLVLEIKYYFITQISEASEEGSLDRNPELMESDEEYQQKNNSNQSPDKKISTSEQDKDNGGNDSLEAKKDTTIETPKDTVTVKDEVKEVNNDRTKDEKEAPTTTSKDISIQTDPNALSPNKYR